MIFDSHAHYNDAKFGTPQERDNLLKKMFSEDIGAVVNASVTPEDSRKTLELCERFPNMYAAVGIHPEDCGGISDIKSAVEEIRKLAAHPKAVAIGEIGYDYYHEPFDKEHQKRVFKAQLELALELDMPVVIHDRDAHNDTDEMLKAYPDVKAVLHSFSGSAEWARQLISNPNRYISFSGVVTFKNARKTVDVAEIVPLDRILIETDCPYLAPTPLRGSINHSQNLIYVAEKLAEIKGLTAEQMIEATFKNACDFYNINSTI